MFPPSVVLPDAVITSILDNFAFNTKMAVTRFVEPYRHLKRYPDRLWRLLRDLVPEFEKIAADRKAENAANRKKKKEANARALKEAEEGSDDIEMEVVDELRDVTAAAVNISCTSKKTKQPAKTASPAATSAHNIQSIIA
ncbi:hypothetical protein MVEN_00081300 [Mycena venus]|uniref:Uncharacterized protein n=1 Tax=Mycena venus TaxID=2733690 RepID=A0A8H7DE77_9AGAR|nr:hypothetical protein MVEN_00081300 [Mycena venus]